MTVTNCLENWPESVTWCRLILMLMLWSTEQNLLIYTVSIIDIFFFFKLKIYKYIYNGWFVLREWISQNNIASKMKPEIWDARKSPFRAKHINKDMSIFIFLWWHSFGPNLWRLYFNVLVHFALTFFVFLIMVLTSMTVISWWWKHYYY